MDPDIFATNTVDLSMATNVFGTNMPGINSLAQTAQSHGLLDEHFLWASCVWGAVAGGYLIYARKQRSIPAFLGGIVMMGASIMVTSWFWMSIVSILVMVGVYLKGND